MCTLLDVRLLRGAENHAAVGETVLFKCTSFIHIYMGIERESHAKGAGGEQEMNRVALEKRTIYTCCINIEMDLIMALNAF